MIALCQGVPGTRVLSEDPVKEAGVIVIYGAIAVAVVLLAAGGTWYVRLALAATRQEQQRHLEERQRALERLANVAEQSLALRLTPEDAAAAAEQFTHQVEPAGLRPDETRAAIADARNRRQPTPERNR